VGHPPENLSAVPTGLVLVLVAYPGLTSGANICRPCGAGVRGSGLRASPTDLREVVSGAEVGIVL